MIIGIFGKLRSGKSMVSEYLEDKYASVEIIDFSDSLKEIISSLYPEKIGGKKDRDFLIKFGQFMRTFDKDIWIKSVRRKIENSKAGTILVTGIRQENEFEMLKEMNCIFVKVEAPEKIRINRCLRNKDNFSKDNLIDQTEVVLDSFDFDFLIKNDGSLGDLVIEIENVIGSLEELGYEIY